MTQSQADTWTKLLAIISAWRREPDKALPCPVCQADGLEIKDRSVRPHAEWYQLNCRVCGLKETVQIPMARPISD